MASADYNRWTEQKDACNPHRNHPTFTTPKYKQLFCYSHLSSCSSERHIHETNYQFVDAAQHGAADPDECQPNKK